MSILGRGSIRDKAKEEQLRNGNDPAYEHLNDDLHVLVEANPPYSHVKLAAGVSEVKKMLIPLVSIELADALWNLGTPRGQIDAAGWVQHVGWY